MVPTPFPAIAFTSSQTSTPTSTSTPIPTSTITPTPLPTIVPPDAPEEGYSNVYGRVLWRGQPVPDVTVFLDNAASESRVEYYFESANSDSAGRFVFTKVPPGDGFVLSATLKLKEVAGIASAPDITLEVPPDTNLNSGDYKLIETDLLILSPERNAEFSEAPSMFSWDAYPGAAYYKIELKQAVATYNDMELETENTSIEMEMPLPLNCLYGWNVTAYDEMGVPIARSDMSYWDDYYDFEQKYDGLFQIKNPSLPGCSIHITSPSNQDEFTGGSNIDIQWEPHPLAEHYLLTTERHTGDLIKGTYKADFHYFDGTYVVQEDGSFDGPRYPSFGKGLYRIKIRAIADDGGWLATGEVIFNVR